MAIATGTQCGVTLSMCKGAHSVSSGSPKDRDLEPAGSDLRQCVEGQMLQLGASCGLGNI